MNDSDTRTTSSHWGAFNVTTRGNRIVGVDSFELDSAATEKIDALTKTSTNDVALVDVELERERDPKPEDVSVDLVIEGHSAISEDVTSLFTDWFFGAKGHLILDALFPTTSDREPS